MKMSFSIPVIALLGGVALGYCFAPKQPVVDVSSVEATAKERTRGRIETANGDETTKALRARIRELEEALSAATAKTEMIEKNVDAPNNSPPRMNWRERIEKMRRENPEEFARMEERRKNFMQQLAERAQSKIDFLAAVDTSRMSEKAKEIHAELQELIAKREELGTKMFSPEMSDEERRQLFQEMRETDRAIRERNGHVRETLLQQTAEALGFSGDDVAEIVETIDGIYEATSDAPPGPPPGDRGGRGRR